ncbi:MAG: hypothetical protein ABIR06_13020 [Cyclobacteriaceae bacterium]
MKVKILLLWVLIIITLIPSYGQGKKIFYSAKIELQNGDIVKGYLIALHDSSIQIQLKVRPPEDTLFTIDRIKIISLRRRNAIDVGLLAGIGTGLVIGIAINAAKPPPPCSDLLCTNVFVDVSTNLFGLEAPLIGMAVGGALGMAIGSAHNDFVIHGDFGLYQNMIDSLPPRHIKKLRMNEGVKLN